MKKAKKGLTTRGLFLITAAGCIIVTFILSFFGKVGLWGNSYTYFDNAIWACSKTVLYDHVSKITTVTSLGYTATSGYGVAGVILSLLGILFAILFQTSMKKYHHSKLFAVLCAIVAFFGGALIFVTKAGLYRSVAANIGQTYEDVRRAYDSLGYKLSGEVVAAGSLAVIASIIAGITPFIEDRKLGK